MGALTDYVTLTITRASVGLTRAGFGTALILTPNVSWAERTRTYNDFDDVIADFPVTSSPEYLAAQALFAQTPAPTKVKFGRCALKPTMTQTLHVVTVRNSYKYQVKVKGCSAAGTAVTATTVEFTSDSGATDAEICAGLVTALNAVVNKDYTAAGASSPITLTATTAGDWFSLEVVSVDDLKVKNTTPDPGFATDLAAIKVADNDFYAVYNPHGNSEAISDAIGDWVEANKKIYMCDTNCTEAIITATGNGEILDDIKSSAFTRTLGFYHHAPDQMAGAALLGRCLPIMPGGETWALKTLAGVTTSSLTATHKTNLQARNANGYESIGSVGVTFDGKVGSGEYLDVTRFIDWFENTCATRIFNALIAEDKKPYTDEGIASVGSEVRGAIKEGIAAGGIDGNQDWTVTLPKVADVPSADKTSRTLNGVKFKFVLAGAIHKVNVVGNVTA